MATHLIVKVFQNPIRKSLIFIIWQNSNVESISDVSLRENNKMWYEKGHYNKKLNVEKTVNYWHLKKLEEATFLDLYFDKVAKQLNILTCNDGRQTADHGGCINK